MKPTSISTEEFFTENITISAYGMTISISMSDLYDVTSALATQALEHRREGRKYSAERVWSLYDKFSTLQK